MAAYSEDRIDYDGLVTDVPSAGLRGYVYEAWWVREQLRRFATEWSSRTLPESCEVVPVILPKEEGA